MTSREDRTEQANKLRRRSEKIALEKSAGLLAKQREMSPEELQRTLQELRTYQVELELQNEELRRAQVALDALSTRYFNLYNLAPVGYCTLSEKGLILEANLAVGTLLAADRGALTNEPISRFVLEEDQDIFYLHRKQLHETGVPQVFELRMVKTDQSVFWAQLNVNRSHDSTGMSVLSIAVSDISENKQAADNLRKSELRESENRFRKLFKQHSAVMLILDAETGRITDANDAALKFYGWTLDELKQMRIHEINTLPPEAVRNEMAKAALLKQVKFNFRHRRANGSIRDVEVFSNKIESDGKELLFSIIHDITERKQAEEASRQERRYLRTILKTTGDGFWEVDTEGRISKVNDAYCRMSGYSRDELLRLHLSDIDVVDDMSMIEARIQRIIAVGSEIFETCHRRKDGSIFHVEISTTYMSTGRGKFVSFCRDITERKQTEEMLLRQSAELAATTIRAEEEKSLLAAVMEALPTGVVITDAKGGIIRTNSAYERIWGGPRPETRSVEDYAVYRAWWGDTDKPVAPEEWASAVAVQKGEATIGQVIRIERFDGSEVFVINSASPVYDTEGGIIGSAVAIQDITEFKRIEQALLENKKDFARAQEVGSIGSWRLDVQRNDLAWSDEIYRIFEVPTETPLRYEMFLAMVHPDDRVYVDTQWQAALRGETYDIEHRIVAGGRIKWVREKAYLEIGKDGILAAGFGITQDITERKQAEEALRKSDERHRVLAKTMLQGVVHLDADGKIIEMNPAAERILGKTREQFHDDDSVRDEFTAIRENGEPFSRPEHPALMALRTGLPERRVIMGVFNPKLGTYRWLSIDAVPVYSPGEIHPSEVYAVFEDITERKQRDEAIHRHNATLSGINEILAAVLTPQTEEDLGRACLEIAQKLTQSKFGFIGHINREGLNDIAISNSGWDACELIGSQGHRTPLLSFKIHGIYGRVISDGRAFFTNDPASHPDRIGLPAGHPPLDAFLGAPLIREGRTIGMIAVANRPGGYTSFEQEILTALAPAMVDAFMRKRTEEALRRSEERFRMLFTRLTVGFCIIEVQFDANESPVDYRFLEINPAFEAQTGLKNAQGKLISELVPDNEPYWLEIYGKVAMTGEPVQFVNEVKALNRWFEVSAYKVEGKDSRKIAILFSDITRRKQTEEQLLSLKDDLEKRVEQRTLELQETQKQYLHVEKLSAIGKLSASIAHEFNNPLQGILSVLKGLKRRATMEEEDKVLLDEAIEEGNRIKELIRSLQEFNRPSSSRKTMMDVHKSLNSVLLLYKNDFKNKRISVVQNFAERLPQINVVADQIKQVFLNLLTNAADACQQPGGVITVSTWQDTVDMVAVAIKDTGVGIKSEEIEQIFQPFYTTKPEIKGTGLGLSVSHGIVKHHRGEIRVDSRPGDGATFIVLLPIKGGGDAP